MVDILRIEPLEGAYRFYITKLAFGNNLELEVQESVTTVSNDILIRLIELFREGSQVRWIDTGTLREWLQDLYGLDRA